MTEATGTRPPVRAASKVPRLAADPERGARREFQRRVLRATLIVDAVVVLTLMTGMVAWKLRAVLLLIVISLFMTLLLHPLVSFLERRNVRRGAATGIVFVFGVAAVATLLFVILRPLVNSAAHLANQLPVIIRQAEHGKGQIGEYVKRFHLIKYVTSKNGGAQSLISRLGKPALSIGKGVLSGVVGLVTIFFLTFFLLIHAPRIYRAALNWMQPERAVRVRAIVSDVERSVVGFIAGDFATSIVAGVVITTTLFLTGVPYPLVLGIWVAVVDFLPLVGGLLAGVPTVIIAALHSLPAGIAVLAVFLVYQEIENHVLYPIIMSRTVRLNSLWVLISVLLGAELGDAVGSVFGAFVGALLAVPAGSAVQVVVRDLWQHRTGTLLLGVTQPAAPVPTAGTGTLDTGVVAVVTGDAGAQPPRREVGPRVNGSASGKDAAEAEGPASPTNPERMRDRDRKRRRRRPRPPGAPGGSG
ncbi:MAG: AI-2E family transporter [Acidimicrobiales bacterium]